MFDNSRGWTSTFSKCWIMALDGLPTHSRVQVKVGLFSFMLGVAVCLAGLVYFNECARDAFDFMTSFMLFVWPIGLSCCRCVLQAISGLFVNVSACFTLLCLL